MSTVYLTVQTRLQVYIRAGLRVKGRVNSAVQSNATLILSEFVIKQSSPSHVVAIECLPERHETSFLEAFAQQ